MFDDVVVVVQLQRLSVHGLVEGPGIGGVLLREHLLQDGIAVFHLLTQLTAFPPPGADASGTHVPSRQVVPSVPPGLGGAGSGFTARRSQFSRFGVLSRRRVGAAGRDGRRGRSGGISFPLHAFLLLERQTGGEGGLRFCFRSHDAMSPHTPLTLTTGWADGIKVAGG